MLNLNRSLPDEALIDSAIGVDSAILTDMVKDAQKVFSQIVHL